MALLSAIWCCVRGTRPRDYSRSTFQSTASDESITVLSTTYYLERFSFHISNLSVLSIYITNQLILQPQLPQSVEPSQIPILRMPPSFDDLSLRHLPDISDASFSFQIPSVSTGDLLIDNDDEKDFFRNADDTMATPGPSKISRSPLTLSELTPRQEVRSYPTAGDEPSLPHDQPPKHKRNPRGIGKAGQARKALPKATKRPTLKVETQADEVRGPEASPGAARLRTLRAEVDLLGDVSREKSISSPKHEHTRNRGQPVGSKKERIIARPKQVRVIESLILNDRVLTSYQVVFSGGISKPRSRLGPSTFASTRTIPSAPQHQPLSPSAQLVHHAPSESAELEGDPDISVCSTTSGGVAERLVMYSQKLIGSFGCVFSHWKRWSWVKQD